MKTLAGVLLVLAAVIPGIDDIARVNKLKKEAEVAYLAGDYEKAARAYAYLTDSLGVVDDKLFLNLGHSLFQQGDSSLAFSQYQRLINSPDKGLKSVALNQMGIISNKPGDRKAALNFFKEALKNDPSNDEARYNYQLVKRQAEQEKEQQQDQQQDKENQEQKQDEQKDQQNQQNQNDQQQNEQQQNKDQQKKDQQSENKEQNEKQDQEQQQQDQNQKPEDQQQKQEQQPEQQSKENKDGEQQPPQINPDKLKEMNISEEKAKMILEAMRNSEIQYIQQNKRKGTKRPESTKPDW